MPFVREKMRRTRISPLEISFTEIRFTDIQRTGRRRFSEVCISDIESFIEDTFSSLQTKSSIGNERCDSYDFLLG